MSYSHLGDAHLAYQSDMKPVVDPDSVPGHLLGSGTGTIDGPHIRGTVRWSFFEEDCAWNPGILNTRGAGPQDPDRSACRTYPRGVIETEDGASLQFDGQGFALRRRGDPTWVVGSTVRFVTGAARYQWLTRALAAYHGIFNEDAGTATWSFHVPASAVPDPQT
jgi:hypothetical protein